MMIFGRKGPSGFSTKSTAEEVTQGIDGSSLTAIITGASSGIGAETARVLAMRGHDTVYPGGIRFGQINDQSGYRKNLGYTQSKLANILHANELARRLKEDGVDITANSLHPGGIMTNIVRHHKILHGMTVLLDKLLLKNCQQGAATTCYVALHPQFLSLCSFSSFFLSACEERLFDLSFLALRYLFAIFFLVSTFVKDFFDDTK
ncbi:NAD(P)-binding Rossmann-fold superfamily protein [Euphorbia peplus]|nr:NAD(P)-binding Rossmann-fold superfamily protein [Euphorbia peplus]